MFDLQRLVRAHLEEMPPYEPILPFDVLSEQLGLPVDRLVKLDANENPYGPLPEVSRALAEMPYVHIYPDPEARHLRAALAERHGLPVENLLAGAGADDLIDLLMRITLDPGDSLLTCPPTFGMYGFDGDLYAARVVNVPRRADFSIDVEMIELAAAAERPKLLFLASPNNPDGSLIPHEEILRFLELPWIQSNPLLVVLDEAYIEFAPPGSSLLREVPRRENLVVLRTFSKWAGLAGLRVGYGAFPSALMPYLWKAKQPYMVSTAASTAALVSLQYADRLEAIGQRLVAERQRMQALLEAIDWLQPYPSQANFILCRVAGRDARSLKAELARLGVLVRYFNKPGLQNCIRISVGRPEQTDILIESLQEAGIRCA